MRTLLTLLITLAPLLALLSITGCASAPNENGEEDPDSFQAVKDIHGGPYTDMMLVYLKTGPKSGDYGEDERKDIFKGHMSNMQRLADAGVLLVAGPFSSPRDKAWRGIFVLDTSSVQLARLQTGTDPGIQSGVLVAHYQPIKSSILLRESGDKEKAMLERNAQPREAGSPPPNLRAYVMLTAEDLSSARAALAKAGWDKKIVWCAKFSGGSAANRDRGAVFVLDAQKPEEITAAFAAAGVAMDGLGLDGWYSTASLTDLAPAVRTLP